MTSNLAVPVPAPPGAPGAAIVCRGLVKRYEDVVAVQGLDLEVRRGECFGLLGPNGAGKTTTVEMLEGLLEPDAGEVEILGARWRDGQYALRDRIGVTLQESQFQDKLTVLETLILFRSFYRRGRAPREVLRLVQLESKARSWVRRLSGGQRQRLSVGCALVGEPEILFLDEPTTGLDPNSRRQIWRVVESFRDAGGTVLLTTHYMEEAQRLCDRVAIMDQGRIIAQDAPSALVASLGGDHVVEFRVEGRVEEKVLQRIPHVRSVRRREERYFLTVREIHRAVPELLTVLADSGLQLTELTTHHATLEDVFVSLTGRHLEEA